MLFALLAAPEWLSGYPTIPRDTKAAICFMVRLYDIVKEGICQHYETILDFHLTAVTCRI
jgi:hypothetical protein